MTDPASAPAGESKSSWLSTLGWAAYLACSWTWCIGMFLPVLLVRDYGIWGFVVFAVPNVVGAGAMGWVLKNAAALRILQSHRALCVTFSGVTIAFQAYFLIYILDASSAAAPLMSSPTPATMSWWSAVCVLAVGIGFAILLGRSGMERGCAFVAWCLSVGIAAYLLLGHGLWGMSSRTLLADKSVGVVFLAPVCVFGFALCPYLDLTFLKAAARTHDCDRRKSFSIGFGVLFLAMILFTLAYSGPFARVANSTSRWTDVPLVVVLVLGHMVIQLTYTIAVHAKEVVCAFAKARPAWLVLASSAGLAIVAWAPASNTSRWQGELSGGEVVYRLFMSFYGLLFPAYVWLCMIPARGEKQTQRPTRQKLTVLAAACLLAAPCYWMGFIERETVWLVPGLGVVLVARMFIRPSPTSESSPASFPLLP